MSGLPHRWLWQHNHAVHGAGANSQTGRTEFEVSEDFYWNIPEKHLYSVYTPPPESELTVGQLSDDWNEVMKIASGQRPPMAYGLVWLSSLLRIVGTKLIS